jgi:hypothetical protein
MQTAVEGAIGISPSAPTIPWFCKAVVFGATCICVGIIWDISWHSTVGRDTFWTPAHMLVYLGGSLGGLVCGWLALKTTFAGTAAERAVAVRFWGLRAPLGAWITIWGSLAMLTSAPFDNWWHDAYGLDVKILSPPHAVLSLGIQHVIIGAIVTVLSLQNRSAELHRRTGRGLFVYSGGVLLAMASIVLTEYSLPNNQHTGTYYRASALLYPVILVAMSRASTLRWPATIVTAIYMGILLAMMWVLPLFPASPKLGPIYNPVERMVPPTFPHLLIVPAVAIDLLFRWLGRGRGRWRDWLLVILMGGLFVGLFLPVQWFFSKFLLSPGADNWFFGGNRYWSYGAGPGEWRTQFWDLKTDPLTWKGAATAVALACASARVGLWWGNWMARVKR